MSRSQQSCIILGRNSQIYRQIKHSLAEIFTIYEVGRENLESIVDYIELRPKYIYIFIGLVTNDPILLRDIEHTHRRILALMFDKKNTQVVLISSSAVYGNHKYCFSEKDVCRPVNNYGASKLRIEKMYQKQIGLNSIILRLGNFIGFDAVGKAFSKSIDKRVIISTDDTGNSAKRTYLDSELLFQSLVDLPSKLSNADRIVNVGRFRAQNMTDVACEIGASVEKVKSEEKISDITLDTSLFHEALKRPGSNKSYSTVTS